MSIVRRDHQLRQLGGCSETDALSQCKSVNCSALAESVAGYCAFHEEMARRRWEEQFKKQEPDELGRWDPVALLNRLPLWVRLVLAAGIGFEVVRGFVR